MKGQIYQDGSYLDNNPTWDIEDSPWKVRQIKNLIEKHGINPTTLGEVGCGAGEIIKQLWISLDCKADSKGFEISKPAYEICKKKAKDNLSYHLEDITNTDDFYHFTVNTNTATAGGLSGGGNNCSAGPATLTA